jgi:SpoVK/Ycf46/Vps4 family AAA+-type ATPase
MRRTQIYLTEEQDSRIAARAVDAGVPKAEVIRGILDQALGLDDGLEERRRAITTTAGVLRGSDDWPQWLARVRRGSADERLRDLGA